MNNQNDPKFEYDIQQRAQAGVKATFRGVVAAYIVYMGYKLIHDADVVWHIAAGAVFIAAALAFGVYTWRRWRIDLEAARLPDADEADSPSEDEEGEDDSFGDDASQEDEDGDDAPEE